MRNHLPLDAKPGTMMDKVPCGARRHFVIRKSPAELCGRTEESRMRNRLLAAVAVAAVVGFGGVAAAESQTDCENKVPAGTTSGAIKQKSGPQVSGDQHSQIKTAMARLVGQRVDR